MKNKKARIMNTYTVDKALYKKVAHMAIDEECDIADIYEKLIEKAEQYVEDGGTVDNIEMKEKCVKTLRLSQEHINMLKNISSQSNFFAGEILNFAVYKFL